MPSRGAGSLGLVLLLVAILITGAAVWYTIVIHRSGSLASESLESTTVPSAQMFVSSTCGVDPTAAQLDVTTTIHSLAAEYPFLGLTPIDRRISLFQPASFQQFSYEGVSIDLPWPGAVTIQSRKGVGTQIRFPNGKFVMLVNPYPDLSLRQDFVNSAKTSDEQAEFYCLFGQGDLKSNEEFFNLVINASPQTLISGTSSPKDVLAQSLLLPIKLTLFYDSSTQTIYRFPSPTFHVFEFTDWPAKEQSYIFLFDAQDRGRLITTSATQNEIDFIVSSIREL